MKLTAEERIKLKKENLETDKNMLNTDTATISIGFALLSSIAFIDFALLSPIVSIGFVLLSSIFFLFKINKKLMFKRVLWICIKHTI